MPHIWDNGALELKVALGYEQVNFKTICLFEFLVLRSSLADINCTLYFWCSTALFSACRKAYVDHPCCVTLFEVIQHGGFSEVGHHGHVLNLVILGRVHGGDISLRHSPFLKSKNHNFIMQLRLQLDGVTNLF